MVSRLAKCLCCSRTPSSFMIYIISRALINRDQFIRCWRVMLLLTSQLNLNMLQHICMSYYFVMPSKQMLIVFANWKSPSNFLLFVNLPFFCHLLSVRVETAFYGSNWAGPCISGHWIPSELFGAFFKNSNIYYARRWTTTVRLSPLFGHYGEQSKAFFQLQFVYASFFLNLVISIRQRKQQAAARHQCTYLVNLHKKEFLEQHGDPNWLKGLDYIPAKLRAIYDINKILAHRP